MAEQKPIYTFDQQSMRRISTAVQKSEGVPGGKGNKWYPIKPERGAVFLIGKTTENWDKNTEAVLECWMRNADGDMVQVKKEDDTPTTFEAYNLFADVAADKFVGCLSNFLISAECS